MILLKWMVKFIPFVKRRGNNMGLILLKFICLFLSVLYGTSIIVNALFKTAIDGSHVLLFALGIVGFVFLQFKLYL